MYIELNNDERQNLMKSLLEKSNFIFYDSKDHSLKNYNNYLSVIQINKNDDMFKIFKLCFGFIIFCTLNKDTSQIEKDIYQKNENVYQVNDNYKFNDCYYRCQEKASNLLAEYNETLSDIYIIIDIGNIDDDGSSNSDIRKYIYEVRHGICKTIILWATRCDKDTKYRIFGIEQLPFIVPINSNTESVQQHLEELTRADRILLGQIQRREFSELTKKFR